MQAGRAMRTKIPLLAVMVSALIMGAAGSAGAGDSSLQPMQLARLDNGSPRGDGPEGVRKEVKPGEARREAGPVSQGQKDQLWQVLAASALLAAGPRPPEMISLASGDAS